MKAKTVSHLNGGQNLKWETRVGYESRHSSQFSTMTAVKLPMMSKRKSSNNRMRPIPKFGEWKEGDPSSAEGFSAIFEERRKEKLNGHASSARITLSEPKKKKRSSFKLKRFIKALKRKWFGCWFPLSS
ncbi:hypothetical protein K2173_002638 [Erythroxylum novogranatense]|uniref:RIN4 pathogenic type III effector avirulence factor Avr cleavage site domain-containing protein n=1 Tax=Erythroxylum novogranatense TaxID=1862640 RepID=A0AAV8SXU0_9ROSI|nr:hypothetical protein K2173_002638 [Erythroxylum novogranatense]